MRDPLVACENLHVFEGRCQHLQSMSKRPIHLRSPVAESDASAKEGLSPHGTLRAPSRCGSNLAQIDAPPFLTDVAIVWYVAAIRYKGGRNKLQTADYALGRVSSHLWLSADEGV